MRTPEQNEVIGTFVTLLEGPTGDGGAKRGAGLKPSWKIDQSHEGAFERHVARWREGELHDKDSGSHPLVHAAWRLLAIAYQELAAAGEIPTDPPHVEVS